MAGAFVLYLGTSDQCCALILDMGSNRKGSLGPAVSPCARAWFVVSHLAAGVGCHGDPISWVSVVGFHPVEDLSSRSYAGRKIRSLVMSSLTSPWRLS